MASSSGFISFLSGHSKQGNGTPASTGFELLRILVLFECFSEVNYDPDIEEAMELLRGGACICHSQGLCGFEPWRSRKLCACFDASILIEWDCLLCGPNIQ